MVPVDTGRRHRWSEDWLRCWLGKSLRCPRYLLLLLHPLPLHLLRGGSHLVHGHVLVAPDLVVVGVDGHEVVESDVDVGLLVGGQDGGLHDQEDSAGPDVQAVGLQDVSVNAPVDLSVIIQQDDPRVPVVGVHIHDLPEEKWNFKAHWSSLSLAPDPVSVELKNLRVLAQRPQLLQVKHWPRSPSSLNSSRRFSAFFFSRWPGPAGTRLLSPARQGRSGLISPAGPGNFRTKFPADAVTPPPPPDPPPPPRFLLLFSLGLGGTLKV